MEISREQETMERVADWEKRNGKKLESLTNRDELIKALQEIMNLTPDEAEDYLTHVELERQDG